jgi:branched-chain amino acid transport system substrate-binding protein
MVAPGLVLGLLFGVVGCKDSGSGGNGGSGGGGNGDEILIGQFASLSGDTATFGQQSNAGVEFAIQELNGKGGVLGKKLRVETQDDRSTAEEARTVVTQFASNPNIVAVIGEVASSRSKAAAQVLQAKGIPMVSPSSTNPDVTKVGEYIFRVCFIDPFQGFVMAKFARENLKAQKIAIMRDQGQDYSVGLADVFKEEFTKMGGTITNDVSYSAKDPDFRSQLSQVKGADAIFIPGYYGEVGTIARQARELGINVPLLGGDGWDSDKLVEGAGGPGKALEGCYFSTHYSKDDKSERVRDFVKRYSDAHNGEAPAALVAMGYDATMILADAIKRANSADRDKIKDALAQTKDYPGVTGNITIDAERNATKSAVVVQIKGNDFVYVATVAPPGGAGGGTAAPAKAASSGGSKVAAR